MLLALVAGLALSPRRIHVRNLLLVQATVPAALRSMRHIPILVLVLVPVLADLAESWLQQRGAGQFLQAGHRPPTRRIVLANLLVLVAFSTFTLLRLRQVLASQEQTEAQHFPQAAAAFLSRERPPGPILNHYNFGGYFIWKLYPQPVFIDGRADVYGDQFMNEFAASYHLTGDWSLPLRRWDIRTLVLPPDAPLITTLRSSPAWTQIYADSSAAVLTKRQ
jgi:hypothetical protein